MKGAFVKPEELQRAEALVEYIRAECERAWDEGLREGGRFNGSREELNPYRKPKHPHWRALENPLP